MADSIPDIFERLRTGIHRLGLRSHTSFVIIMADILDRRLQKLLETMMSEAPDALKKRLFDGYGPLSTFAARMDVARALGLMTDQTYKEVRLLNKIRVIFAHSPELVTLYTPSVHDLLAKLITPLPSDPDQRLQRFTDRVAEIDKTLIPPQQTDAEPRT